MSQNYCPWSVFLAKTLYVWYILANGITALHKKFCIVILSVLIAWSKLMPHRSLKLYEVTYMWRYKLWKVLRYGTSYVPIYISSFLTITNTSFETFIDINLLFILFISKTQYLPTSYSSRWDLTTSLIYHIPPTSSSYDWDNLENKFSLDTKDVVR